MLHASNQPHPDSELLAGTTILSSLPDGVVVCDLEGIVRFINPAAARLLGIDVNFFLGRSAADLPGNLELNQHNADCILNAVVQDARLRFRITPVWSLVEQHVQTGTMIVFKERPPEIDDIFRLMSSVISELRTPLTAIRGFSELLLRVHFDTLTKRHYQVS
jgi:PAS domain S-box-containing protein